MYPPRSPYNSQGSVPPAVIEPCRPGLATFINAIELFAAVAITCTACHRTAIHFKLAGTSQCQHGIDLIVDGCRHHDTTSKRRRACKRHRRIENSRTSKCTVE